MPIIKGNCRYLTLFLLCFLALVTPHPLPADPGIDYPVVLTTPQDLAEFGIEYIDWEPDRAPAGRSPGTLCYNYSNGLFVNRPMALSEDLLSHYRTKGFSREALCMALVSKARFDPDTGARLPTYLYRDDVLFDQALDAAISQADTDPRSIPQVFRSPKEYFDAIASLKRRDFGALPAEKVTAIDPRIDAFVWERLLAVPACFKNGTPYLDCKWNYGLKDGQQLTPEKRQTIRNVGLAIDRQIRDAITGQNALTVNESGEKARFFEPLFLNLREGLYAEQPDSARISAELLVKEKSIAWYDISPAFPRGCGYAYYADLSPDPGFTPESIDPSRVAKTEVRDRIKKAAKEYGE